MQEENQPKAQLTGASRRMEEDVELGELQQYGEEAWGERLRLLLDGKITPANEFVAYLISKANQAKAEAEASFRKLNQAQKTVVVMKSRVADLKAQFDKYSEDIKVWDKKLREPRR